MDAKMSVVLCIVCVAAGAVSDVQKLEDHDFDYPGGKSEPEGSSGNDRNR